MGGHLAGNRENSPGKLYITVQRQFDRYLD
jgi:hypothetical protein